MIEFTGGGDVRACVSETLDWLEDVLKMPDGKAAGVFEDVAGARAAAERACLELRALAWRTL